jgi:hypothetical protein
MTDNNETVVNEAVPDKPKRVLTEAQRLAFIKGREKRMQNIMMKKAAKEEESKLSPEKSPIMLKLKRTKKTDTEEESKPDHPSLNVDAIADKLFEKMQAIHPPKETNPGPTKRKYTRRKEVKTISPPTTPPPDPESPRPVRVSYNWL